MVLDMENVNEYPKVSSSDFMKVIVIMVQMEPTGCEDCPY